ncbi:MAG TPA: hypothetical protein VN632_05960 [Stellaceae bacterium]|jgi:hypothetical protein|nr:hypothetical protein [Stellaceae bacterium]
MRGNSITTLTLAAVLLLLTGCKFPTLAQQQSPSTAAGIETDLMTSLPASSTGFAPPIMVTTPTR